MVPSSDDPELISMMPSTLVFLLSWTWKGGKPVRCKYNTRKPTGILLFSWCIRNTVAITVPEGVSGLCEISKI